MSTAALTAIAGVITARILLGLIGDLQALPEQSFTNFVLYAAILASALLIYGMFKCVDLSIHNAVHAAKYFKEAKRCW